MIEPLDPHELVTAARLARMLLEDHLELRGWPWCPIASAVLDALVVIEGEAGR